MNPVNACALQEAPPLPYNEPIMSNVAMDYR